MKLEAGRVEEEDEAEDGAHREEQLVGLHLALAGREDGQRGREVLLDGGRMTSGARLRCEAGRRGLRGGTGG